MTVTGQQAPSGPTRTAMNYLATESGSALMLLGATALALLWVNSPIGDSYEQVWQTTLSLRLGDSAVSQSLREWVNGGLMTLFFFLIGLEIARELSVGEYKDRRAVVVPAIAALGGIVLPALLYLALVHGGPAGHGWGIVMSTDTAFALGVLALVGPRCPTPLRVFLLALAIVDDIAAITVIALFYTAAIDLVALAVAVGLFAVLVALRAAKVGRAWPYVVTAVLLWFATYASGVHPTVVGVLTGVLFAAYTPADEAVLHTQQIGRAFLQEPTAARARELVGATQQTVSANDQLTLRLHPLTSFVVVPVFALANAGVPLNGTALRAAAASAVTHGVVLGLLAGKVLGILAGTWLALKVPRVTFVPDVRWGQMLGTSAVAGIGFTVALFITELAFDDPQLQQDAKIGIVVASALAALVGYGIFRFLSWRGSLCQPDSPPRLPDPAEIPDPA